MNPGGPFSIPAIKNCVPEKIKPWIIILFVVIFQFAGGGVYLATLNQVVGAQSLLPEDVLMAGYASLIGTGLAFTIMLRIKLRFLSKHIFIASALGLVACNVVCLYTDNVFILVSISLLAGLLRMLATFECNSTIQLWITPKRDLTVFFCYIYLLVQSSILLSGSTQLYIAYFSSWQDIHLLVIGLLLMVVLISLLLFSGKRFMRPFPLFGIDWLGMFLWALILLCINFIAVYGDHYDWWQSEHIRVATLLLLIVLVLNLYRASFIRHPYISLQTFKFKIVYSTFFIYLLVVFLISPAHLMEEIYMHEIVHYDTANIVRMNMIGLIGIVMGTMFTYFYFAKAKHSFKSTFMIGFSSIIMYLYLMYFYLDYNTSFEMLAIALFFRNVGYVIVAIVLLSSLVKVPFPNFFQSLTVQSIVSAACGSAVCGSVLHHIFNVAMARNFQQLSAHMDRLQTPLDAMRVPQFMAMLHQQTLMVSFKEVYGLLLMGAGILFVLLLCVKNPYLRINRLRPKHKALRHGIAAEIKGAK